MKIIQLATITILMVIGVLVVPSAQNAKAIPYFSPQELYNLSDIVFYGQVLTKGPGPGPDYYYYQVQVMTYFKNQQTSDTITVAGHKPGDPRAPYPQFEVGDNAIFYIRKTDGINNIYWNSQKAGNACNVQSFLESSPISANPKIGPAPSTHIYVEDVNGIMPYIPLTNHTAVFHDDDVWNNYPESRTVPVTLSIRDKYDGHQVFNQTQTLEMQACSGPEKVQWNFVPTQITNYVATVTDDKSKISMSFNSIYNYAADSQIILPPLKQFKSGVAAKDVKCKEDLQLIIKSEDNSPACVKPNTAQKLIERGWTRSILSLHPNLDVESKIANNDTYLSQTVDEWKSKTPEQLGTYYKKYKDAFYDELGSFLIKDEMKKELARQKIQNIHDDFKVFPGMTLDSLPPHISYDAVVNATDGNSYLLLGGVFANKIDSSLKIIKLVFDKNALHSLSTGNGPSYPDPSANAHVDNSTSQEKVQIAGTYIEDSDIPWSSVGTGNYGVIQIGLYTSVYHMIPDAQKYYTARAMQLIPFYIPVKILPPSFTEK